MVGKKLAFTSLPSLSKVLTEDQDIDTFSRSRPKHVPLWTSPLKEHGKGGQGEAGPTSRQSSEDQLLEHGIQQSSLDSAGGSETLPTTAHVLQHKEHFDSEEPVLKTPHESSVIQLFYDLFFVANLTTFTAIHEVTDAGTVISYIGFFAFLWFTWLQVTLFDVHFANNSVFERTCKLLQFGVMTGLAVVAPNFSYSSDHGLEAFQTLSLIITVSRLILAGQYAVILWSLRNYKRTRLPMIGLVAVEFIIAMVSLGIFFSFQNGSGYRAAIGWDFMFAFEAVSMMAISGRVGFLKFRGTAIVERLGLLTLIILGEGVIGLTESIAKTRGSGLDGFTADIIGQIIASVAILYFLWILYFDQIETERMSTLHQQYWVVLHFPYHVSVLLVVEGIAQLTVWRKLYDVFTTFSNAIYVVPTDNLWECVQSINKTFNSLYEQFSESEVAFPNISEDLDAILGSHGNATIIQDRKVDVVDKGIDWLTEVFEVKVPERFLELEAQTEAAEYFGVLSTYTTVFLYLFISAGLVLILLAALFGLGNRHKTPGEWISIGVRGLVGVAIAMLAIMVITLDKLLVNYVRSAIHKR